MSVAPIAQNTEAVVWRCSVKKVLDILKISLQITYTRVSLFFSCFLRICIKCFSVNFAKFLIKTFSTEHFWWLLSMISFYFPGIIRNFFLRASPPISHQSFPLNPLGDLQHPQTPSSIQVLYMLFQAFIWLTD